jgi:hypothetical protein
MPTNRFMTHAQWKNVASKILKSGDYMYICDNYNTPANILQSGGTTNYVSKISSSSHQQWGNGLTSPVVDVFHIHSLEDDYTRHEIDESDTYRYFCVENSPAPYNYFGVCKPNPSNVDVATDTWSNDATNQGHHSNRLYAPNYTSGGLDEIESIINDIWDGNDPAPASWLSEVTRPPTTEPIYLNHLYQRKTPFYDPVFYRAQRAFRKSWRGLF